MKPLPGVILPNKNKMGRSTPLTRAIFSAIRIIPLHFQSAFGVKQRDLS
jgi:hypothetical protein